MERVEIQGRPIVKDLAELSGIDVGEPFKGRINSPGAFKGYWFIKPEMQKEDNYLFLTLPGNEGIHQVEVAGRDIMFMDVTMRGTIQPIFDPSKARINTYSPKDNWFEFYQKRVFESLKAYREQTQKITTSLREGKGAEALL